MEKQREKKEEKKDIFKQKSPQKTTMDCDFEECDCEDCCFPSDRGRGTQGLHGPMAMDIPGPQGFVGPDYTAPQGARGYQGMECCNPEALRGTQGIQGPQGQNQDGFQGAVGPQGSTTSSFDGAQGPTGYDGAQGQADLGMQGRQGMDVRGPQGPQGVLGSGGSTGAIGPQGTRLNDMYIGPNPIDIPALNEGTIASFSLPGPGTYLVTICFSVLVIEPQIRQTMMSFNVSQGATIITQCFTSVLYSGSANSRRTLIVMDAITVNSLPIDVRFSWGDPVPIIVFDFFATSIQTQ